MPRITNTTRLEQVDHILGSGTGLLDFSVEGEQSYYTWEGTEGSHWEIEDVASVENDTEDRIILYPEGESFVCEIEASGEQGNEGPVHCWCDINK